MATYTSTHTNPPTCENCGRDKQATYICDACCAKLNAATRKLTAERDAAIDEKLFWVDKYAYEMEKSDRRCDQWERCFRLAFGLKNKYHSNMCALIAERDELQRRLDAVVAIANKLPDKLCVYRSFAGVTYKDRSVKDELRAIAEGRTE